MKKVKILVYGIILALLLFLVSHYIHINPRYHIGQKIDSHRGVAVYYNGPVHRVEGRNLDKSGYNIGLKYQCVEFVKRFYLEALHHKMPNSYGHAKDFFDRSVKDGNKNNQRNLRQYTNPSTTKPQLNDLLIFDATLTNKYGHVAIITEVTENSIEIIQQNTGPFGNSRERIPLEKRKNQWYLQHQRLLGWLRK